MEDLVLKSPKLIHTPWFGPCGFTQRYSGSIRRVPAPSHVVDSPSKIKINFHDLDASTTYVPGNCDLSKQIEKVCFRILLFFLCHKLRRYVSELFINNAIAIQSTLALCKQGQRLQFSQLGHIYSYNIQGLVMMFQWK